MVNATERERVATLVEDTCDWEVTMAKKSGSKPRTAPTTGYPASSKPPKEPGDWVRMHLYNEWRDVALLRIFDMCHPTGVCPRN